MQSSLKKTRRFINHIAKISCTLITAVEHSVKSHKSKTIAHLHRPFHVFEVHVKMPSEVPSSDRVLLPCFTISFFNFSYIFWSKKKKKKHELKLWSLSALQINVEIDEWLATPFVHEWILKHLLQLILTSKLTLVICFIHIYSCKKQKCIGSR